MKFLVDNQLPLALARHLESHGLAASHVAEIGLDQATDDGIWQYAADGGFAIISKDEDFLHLSIADPNGPSFV